MKLLNVYLDLASLAALASFLVFLLISYIF